MISKQPGKFISVFIMMFFLALADISAEVQPVLERRISLDFRQSPLHTVLREIERTGAFTFSYNSRLIPKDSLVTIQADGQTVANVLKSLFQDKYQFSETNNFLIIALRPGSLKIITTDVISDQQSYSISGLVVDEISGKRLMNVSVYEKRLLAATLTDEFGFFKLKCRTGSNAAITLTASKLQYRDTAVNFLQPLAVSDRNPPAVNTYDARNPTGIEKQGLDNPNYTSSGFIKSYYGKTPRSIIAAAGAGYDLGHGLETNISYDTYLGQDMNLATFGISYKFRL